MESLMLNESVCRICLKQSEMLDWNEEIFEFCGISYKDCYYKYTQLDENDSDCYTTNLCEMCAEELKNAHFLFEKALESFNILRATFNNEKLSSECNDMNIWDDQTAIEFKIDIINENSSSGGVSSMEELLSNETDKESLAESENALNISKEMSMIENVIIESADFLKLEKNESTDDPLVQQQINKNDIKLSLSAPKKYSTRRNRCQLFTKMEPNKSCDAKIPKSEETKNRRDNYELKFQKTLEANVNKRLDSKSLEPSITKKSGRIKKKNILICQYCSFKVDGTSQLKSHEATHSENRERNQTCPICGIKLYTKQALNGHMKTHDENRQKKQKCEFCRKAFFNKGALNVHRRIHLGLMVKCHICQREFYRQIDLDRHLLRHSASPLAGKKQYVVQCPYCNKSVFTSKWKEHKAAHLDQPEVKCKLCEKDFFSRARCTKHLRQVHGKSFKEYDELIYYYVERKDTRFSNLLMKQQLIVQPLKP